MRAAYVCLAVALSLASAPAADLRIETRVYDTPEADASPISKSVTYYRDGVVYDLRPAEARTTVFRAGVGSKPGRFLLLDTQREQQTEISSQQIAATMAKLRRWAAGQQDPLLRFTASPRFEESFDHQTGELLLTSDQLSYRIVAEPLKHPEMAGEVRGFLDGFAQLHTLLEAGLPPEPRLRMNEALLRRRLIPLRVELTARNDEQPSLRGEYEVAWVLSKRDLAKIDVIADQIASFQKVSNADFQRGRKQVASR